MKPTDCTEAALPFTLTENSFRAGAASEPEFTKFQFVTVAGSGALEVIRCNSNSVGESTCRLLSPIFGNCNPRQSIAVVPGTVFVEVLTNVLVEVVFVLPVEAGRMLMLALFGEPTVYAPLADNVSKAVSGFAPVELASAWIVKFAEADPAGMVTETGTAPPPDDW